MHGCLNLHCSPSNGSSARVSVGKERLSPPILSISDTQLLTSARAIDTSLVVDILLFSLTTKRNNHNERIRTI